MKEVQVGKTVRKDEDARKQVKPGVEETQPPQAAPTPDEAQEKKQNEQLTFGFPKTQHVLS